MDKIVFKDGTFKLSTKIIGIGLNYTEHIEEMHSQKTGDPVIFLKPPSALCDMSKPIRILTDYGAVHHEIELAVCISKKGSNIAEKDAYHFVAGYGLILDLTLRDLQMEYKKAGLPWAVAKGFDNSCPVSTFVPAKQISNPHNLNLRLTINNQLKQNGHTSQMIYRIPELIAYISKFFTLMEGDLILTGTPAGVGPIVPGDKIHAEIDQIAAIDTVIISGGN
ncbi:MAG: fumarylacetoacetate hydrolase family protein [Calditrichaceae bacterium]|nr:fumarylacetoacetate hydrolase family protein [Calditrichaceae bacterium]MBN2708297.1 fumarylacetoacetate hydrolase family protein [Calditrichaceae bacterium]RQV91939.1 MAG: fumarylacetoacetate hydrolase family protein [Calditrichota bacterium]